LIEFQPLKDASSLLKRAFAGASPEIRRFSARQLQNALARVRFDFSFLFGLNLNWLGFIYSKTRSPPQRVPPNDWLIFMLKSSVLTGREELAGR